MEKDVSTRATLLFSLADSASKDINFINQLGDESLQNEMQFLTMGMRRPANVLERNLIGWEPKCIGW